VAFDIDGTLYPEWRLNLAAFPYVLHHLGFFLHYATVRSRLHEESRRGMAPCTGDFFRHQAQRLSEVEHSTIDAAAERIHRIVYRGLMPFFPKIKPFPGALEAIRDFRAAGLKIGVLSDFPPEQKADLWGMAPLCDVVLGSEKIGALKPSPLVFEALRKELGVEAGEILYVGNSLRSDIRGAKNAGMHTAWLAKKKAPEADFSFTRYSQLAQYVLY
jgi:putative hydrolase of the HAD superfamily